MDGEIAGRLLVGGNAPFAYAGALDDPFVAGVDHARQIRIAHDTGGKIRAHSFDHRTTLHARSHFHCSSYYALTAARGVNASICLFISATSAAILATRPFLTVSMATSIAVANPRASVPP